MKTFSTLIAICLLSVAAGNVRLHAAVPSIASGDTVMISAGDPRINYYGRFDFTAPAKPRFNWSGAIIEASFPGPIIGMRLTHSNAYYDIEIDGVLDTTITTGNKQVFFFRSDLSASPHTVRIILRSEDHWGVATFSGLYIAKGKELGDAPSKPQRRIEFIGDSYTAGYGTEHQGRSCDQETIKKYTNTNRTFAGNVTRAFHAQSIIMGWSGAGMVRNYGEGGKRSDDPFPTYYDRTLGAADNTVWDFSKWKPELAVINLGTNDYSTDPNPDDSMYVGDYHKFISRILGNYPDAAILCVATGDDAFEKNVKRIVAEETASLNHPKVYSASYPSNLDLDGCDWHPSIDDNKKVAAALIDTIMKKLNWDTTASIVAMLPSDRRKTIASLPYSPVMLSNRLQLTAAASIPRGTIVSLMNLRGELLDRRETGPGGTCVFTMDSRGPGMYLAGNGIYGWVRVVRR